MSFGSKMSVPFSDATLVPQVLAHQDWTSKGYVWGFDGAVHYCFLDPGRVQYKIWKKRFHWSSLGWLLINLIAAIALIASGNVPGGITAFIAIPTLPLALLYHYRNTAEEQPAAVVSNGPQMQYPGGLSTAGMAGVGAAGTGIGAIGGGLLAGLSKAVPAAGAKIAFGSLGTLTLSTGFIAALAAIGTGVNVGALTIFIAGFFAKPFDKVITPIGIGEVPNPIINGWYHLGRNGTAIGNYRIAAGSPNGLTWGSGGLIPVVVNGASAWRLGSSAGAAYRNIVRNAHDLVVWGIILRSSDPGEGPPPYEEGSSPSETPVYEPPTNPDIGMLVVIGTETWSNAYSGALIMHGCVNAVATDGRLSPLMGTHGSLVIDQAASMFLDPIQRYGFSCEPE